MEQGEEKTEQPSEFKLREARKKGQVAKSADVVALTSLMATSMFLACFLPFCFKKFEMLFLNVSKGAFSHNASYVQRATIDGLDLWFYLSIPILFIAMLGAIIGNVIQFGFLLSSHPIKFDLKKIDPIAGFKKLFSKNRLVELIKQIIKLSIVSLVIYSTMVSSLRDLSLLFRVDLYEALRIIIDLTVAIIIRVILCFLVIAGFDFFWQRYSFLKSMRMSKYEVKKEYKQQEGDPHIKQERRRLQHETLETLSNGSMKDASVVITNPSHLAVALRYDENNDVAPQVIAKGSGMLAKKIIAHAQNYSVPVIRNVPLAHDLMWLEINEEIPKNLYESVAEILTFLHELNEQENP